MSVNALKMLNIFCASLGCGLLMAVSIMMILTTYDLEQRVEKLEEVTIRQLEIILTPPCTHPAPTSVPSYYK